MAKWRESGFNVCIVCMTNGDAGHQSIGREELAARRKREAAASAAIIGAESIVLDNHDGELLSTLDVRKQVISLIRRFHADVVVTHRPNDYHPDHRYTAQLVQDAAYMVTVPHVVEQEPSLRHNPVFLYFNDHFERPVPSRADVAVAVDDVMDTKWAMLHEMTSQFYEWMPWHDGGLESVPADDDARIKWLRNTWGPRFRSHTNRASKGLKRWYGKAKASKVRYAEAFEVSEYGRQPDRADLEAIFPFIRESRAKKKDRSKKSKKK